MQFSKLDKRVSKCHIILEAYDKHLKRSFASNDVKNAISNMSCSFWLMPHFDELLEDGTYKHNHYHIVLSFHSPKSLRDVLNLFCSNVGCSLNCCSIAVATDLLSNIRYLCHKDHPEKNQYNFEDVITNNLGILKEAEIYVTSLTTSDLVEIVDKCCSKRDILYALGLSNFKKYSNIINTLWSEKYDNSVLELKIIEKTKKDVFASTINTLKQFALDFKCEQYIDLIVNRLQYEMRCK